MPHPAPTFLIGDLHGHYSILLRLLRGTGLIDRSLHWSGGSASLWCIGDLFDRGPDGVNCAELLMNLQDEARQAGGSVGVLMGNHDLMIMAVYCFGPEPTSGPGGTFHADWLHNGGNEKDLQRLQGRHVAWLATLPAMARVGDHLLVHADAELYREYGSSIEEVNRSFAGVRASDDPRVWDAALRQWGRRGAFYRDRGTGREGAAAFLQTYGGRQVIHGHTPIATLLGCQPQQVTQPYIYAGGLAVNLDHGLYLGGPGFIYRLEPPPSG